MRISRRLSGAVVFASSLAISTSLVAPSYAGEAPIAGSMQGNVNVQESTLDDSCVALNNSDPKSVDIDGAPDSVTTSIGGGIPGDGESAYSHTAVSSTRASGLLTDVLIKSNVTASAHDSLGGNDPDTSEMEGSHCSHFARAEASGEVTFTLVTKRKVRLTVAGDLGTLTLSGGTLSGGVLADNNTEYDDILNNVVVGLGPGDYYLDYEAYAVEAKAGWGQPIATGAGASVDNYIDFKMHLWKPGQATGAATGAGAKYVAYPASRNCPKHSITVGVRYASLIKSVTIAAAGQSKTVTHPSSTTRVTLTSLPDATAFPVRAVVRLKSGSILKASRPYARC
jgi:hypothetical protein